jgi:hypothetical protein
MERKHSSSEMVKSILLNGKDGKCFATVECLVRLGSEGLPVEDFNTNACVEH